MKSKKVNQSKPCKCKKPIFRQWWFWVIIAIVVGCLFTVALIKALHNRDTVHTTPTLNTAPQNNYITCNVGETFDANGMHITYLGAEKWLPEGETEHPKAGYFFLRVKIAAENKSTEIREIYDNEFICIADGILETAEFFTNERLKGGMLEPGQRDEGYLYFSVYGGSETIELRYTSYLTWRNNFALLPVKLTN